MRFAATFSLFAFILGGSLPAQQAVGFNSDDFRIVTDAMEQRALLTNTPQWVVQLLRWPSQGEIESHLGIRADEQIAQATADLQRVLAEAHVPADLSPHWVPLRDWNVFYTDWIDHGGADAFLANWEIEDARIQVIDSPNFVVVGIRPSTGRSGRLTAEQWVVQVVDALCADAVKPVDPDSNRHFRTIEIYEPNATVEGDWVPRGAEDDASAGANPDIERVKFFTNSHIVALSVPKYLWNPDSLVNPFAERFPRPANRAEIAAISEMLFQPDRPLTPEPVLYDQSRMRELVEELLRTTPSDALLNDWSRRMIGPEANPREIDRLFENLTTEQKGLWHAQQLSERLMAEGVRSLAQERYDEAATRFMHVLLLEPENVSASMMLKITRDRAQEWALSRTEQSGRLPWFSAAEQMLERHRLAVEERRIQMQERSERELQLRDLRTQWLEAYQEGDLRRARQILQRMLEIDPGNASARFFVGLIEHMMEIQEAELE